jgi:hypothetical protein
VGKVVNLLDVEFPTGPNNSRILAEGFNLQPLIAGNSLERAS